MALTVGNWIFIGVIAFFGLLIMTFCLSEQEGTAAIITIAITLCICFGFMLGLSWWNTNTASGARALKDQESNFNGGLVREITITAEDGREIFHYEGKIDVETKHEGNANYILFESEDGRRYIIYYGITDTMTIIEKAS